MTAGDIQALSDAELVGAFRADRHGSHGSRAASALLERYQDRVYVWCYRVVRDHNRALDLAQETLINAYRGLDAFEGRSGFGSWLFMIARHRCVSEIRSASRRKGEEILPDDLADPGPSPDEILESRTDEEEVLELIRRRLDPVEQEALWLRCFEGLPVDEITHLLGIGASTGARSVLQRARRKLRAARDAHEAPGAETRKERKP